MRVASAPSLRTMGCHGSPHRQRPWIRRGVMVPIQNQLVQVHLSVGETRGSLCCLRSLVNIFPINCMHALGQLPVCPLRSSLYDDPHNLCSYTCGPPSLCAALNAQSVVYHAMSHVSACSASFPMLSPMTGFDADIGPSLDHNIDS